MKIEYEATFININKDEIRSRLGKIGAELIKPEILMKRVTFNMPKGHELEESWVRVRDEGDKITSSIKSVINGDIESQKEAMIAVDDFENASHFLEILGCTKKSYQETKREIWKKGEVDICIDEWPFLEPFVEIEGHSEKSVKNISEQLGFEYKNALFCGVGHIYEMKYGIKEEIVNQKTPLITFEMQNPFIS